MDEEAVARRRAWQLDGQADELGAAARRLRMVASQVTGPLQQVEDRLGLPVWEGNADQLRRGLAY